MNNPGDEFYDMIPDNREAIAQYLLLYSMNGNPEDLEKLIDFNYENAQIMIRINEGSNATINNVIGEVRRLTAGDPNFKRVGGYGYVTAQLANLVVRGQVSSLLVSLILCALILAIAFRSIVCRIDEFNSHSSFTGTVIWINGVFPHLPGCGNCTSVINNDRGGD